jgi:hypothetical protein
MSARFIRRVLTLIGTVYPMSLVAAVRYVDVRSTNPVPPYTSWKTAAKVIQDAVDAAEPGDEVVVTDGVYQSGGREAYPGAGTTNRVAVIKPLTVRSVNGAAVTIIRGRPMPDPIRGVYLTHQAMPTGFTIVNGGTFKAGAGVFSESTAVVTNCVITGNAASFGGTGGGAAGGTLNDCVISSNSAMLSGGGASGATLNNCDVHHNHAGGDGWQGLGGGVSGSILKNCSLRENTAVTGGGAYDSTLENCLVVHNSASQDGGGVAIECTFRDYLFPELKNCTIAGNSAVQRGGGVWSWSCECGHFSCDEVGCTVPAKLSNCIVHNNHAPEGANHSGILGGYVGTGSYLVGGQMFYSSTTPLPTNGFGNIANAPLFMDAAAGDFRLQSNSPCINAGRNTAAPAGLDLDGKLRVIGGTVDMGAYEFQSRPSLSFGLWAAGFGLSGAAAAADRDPDIDGFPNIMEFILGGNPTVAGASRAPAVTNNGGAMVFTFPRDDASESQGVTLTVESGTDLATWPAVYRIGPDTAASAPGVTIVENGAAPDMITVFIPQGSGPSAFARLKATIEP